MSDSIAFLIDDKKKKRKERRIRRKHKRGEECSK